MSIYLDIYAYVCVCIFPVAAFHPHSCALQDSQVERYVLKLFETFSGQTDKQLMETLRCNFKKYTMPEDAEITWAMKALQLRLVLTGSSGDKLQEVGIGEEIWLSNVQSVDGAGHAASHFRYLWNRELETVNEEITAEVLEAQKRLLKCIV